jgi:hypothetical protein
MESEVDSQSAAESALPAKRFRLSFGLGHLLTLMAGLGVGMAIMQPWKTWERPPAPVDYDVAVISITDLDEGPTKGDRENTIRKTLLEHFTPSDKTPGELPFGKLLGTSCLSTIEGEAGVMEVTLPLSEGQKAAPDNFKIQLKPYSARGPIRTGITSEFSWLPNFTAPTEKTVTQKSGATELYELASQPSPDGKEKERIFLVLTPQDATKRQFTIKPASSTTPSAK